MSRYTNDALGVVVRELRQQLGLTQDDLGDRAGYGKGAGVSISRLEKGLVRPVADRLAGIAKALGLSLDELETRAAERTTPAQADSDKSGQARVGTPPSSKQLKERAKRIQREVDRRTAVITKLSDAFNTQHDRSRDEFFLRFVDVASRIDGAPQPDPTQLEDDETTEIDAVAAYRLQASSAGVARLLAGGAGGAAAGAAVGGAAAYGTFVAAASFGTASTGVAISGLSGVAATNATLALLGGGTLATGGAGVAGGTMALASIVAWPTVILFAGGLFWMAKRNRKQQQELAAKFDEAEAELKSTRPGVEALESILPRATDVLDYIATHAGHALTRWADQLGPDPTSWDSLDPAARERYQAFIDIAAAQITLVTINVEGLLTTRGADQQQLIELADQVLTQSDDIVKAHV